MSEVQSRGTASRGRGSYRGGRGGYRGARGGGAKSHTKSEEQDSSPSFEEQGEVGELKAKYADQLSLLRPICEGWSDEDLVFALQETGGDVEAALDRITSGTISQWGEVKKKPVKGKDLAHSSETHSRGRGRGSHEGRGRGRGTERVARAGRGGRTVSQANGTKTTEKPTPSSEEPTIETTQTIHETAPTNGDAVANFVNDTGKDSLTSLATEEPKPASAAAPASSKVSGWAGLFAKPVPPPAPKKTHAPVPTPTPASDPEPPLASIPVAAPEELVPVPAPVVDPSVTTNEPPSIEPVVVDDSPSELPSAHPSETGPELTPSKDELTEKNLDKLPDVSHPLASQTVASTTASTQDPMNPAIPIAPMIRPGMSGFAASALKATSGGRAASYSRKLAEQQEAVVMPGNHAIDRAAVQFGKMGMGDDDLDAEEEREEPETRTQLPDDSPAAPRASLPPAIPEAKGPSEPAAPEHAAPRQAPGLPPASQQIQPPSPQQATTYAEQFRYGQGPKSYDPFAQQPQGPATTEAFSSQIPGQAQGTPGAGQDYPQYYSREYQQYYAGAYGQGHESTRSGSAFGTSAPDAQGQYATVRPQQGFSQPETHNSGDNTPSQTASGHQGQHAQQQVPGQASHGAYPYAGYPNAYGQQYPSYNSYMAGMSQRYGANRPMFDDVRRDGDYYGNPAGYNHNQQYGSSYKSGMYGQPQQYSHEYSSSPANTSGFGGREGNYGRASSTQPSESQQGTATSSAFGGMADPFGRTSSAFGQSQGHNAHQGSEDQTKASGPSPSLQGNRPGSALNNMSSQQGGLPHPQSQHSGQAFGGYPQYGGFGNQTHQNTGYGAYGSNAGFGGYGGAYGRGGWSGNYGSGHT